MKKFIFSFILLFSFSALFAQTDTQQELTGKYKFPEGSPVTEIGIVIEKGVLTATSAMGNSELKKTENKDVYEIVSFGGTATFKRNTEGKITSVVIQSQDVTMEGAKTVDGLSIRKNL